MKRHSIYNLNLTVHALHGQRQIVNIRVDQAGKHTVLTFCPVRKNLNSQSELTPPFSVTAGVCNTIFCNGRSFSIPILCCRDYFRRLTTSRTDCIPPVGRGNISTVINGMPSSSPPSHAARWSSCKSTYRVMLAKFRLATAISRRGP